MTLTLKQKKVKGKLIKMCYIDLFFSFFTNNNEQKFHRNLKFVKVNNKNILKRNITLNLNL